MRGPCRPASSHAARVLEQRTQTLLKEDPALVTKYPGGTVTNRIAYDCSSPQKYARARKSTKQEALACSGRLNLCSKTRELTDNQPKYTYHHGDDSPKDGGSRLQRSARAVGRGWRDEQVTAGREGGGESARAPYRDAGDRLYSEWKEARRKDAQRRGAGEVARDASSSEGWSCPKCGADNRREAGVLLGRP